MNEKTDNQMDNESKQSFIDHLEELRGRLIRILVCAAILFPVGYWLSNPALQGLKNLAPELKEMIYIHPLGLFFVRMKLGLIIALFLGFPYMAYQVWVFVAPGLFESERKHVLRFALASTFFFLLGASFAIFAIFPALTRFSAGMATADIVPRLEVRNVVNMAGLLALGFGVVFQLPIAVFILVRSGLVEAATLRKNRAIVYVGTLVVSALLTPPDVVSQLAMGVPAVILFEFSLFFASLAKNKNRTMSR